LIDYLHTNKSDIDAIKINSELLKKLHPYLIVQNSRWESVPETAINTTPKLLNSYYSHIKKLLKDKKKVKTMIAGHAAA